MRWEAGSGARLAHAVVLQVVRVPVFVLSVWAFATFLSWLSEAMGMAVVDGDTVTVLSLTVGFLGVYTLVFRIGLFKVGQLTLGELGWRWEAPGRVIGRGLVGFLLCAGVLWLANRVQPMPTSPMAWQHPRLWLLLGTLDAVVVGESLARGYLQPALVARLGFKGGVVAQSLVVALLYFQHPVRALAWAVAGVVLGAVRGEDGSLWAPALAMALLAVAGPT